MMADAKLGALTKDQSEENWNRKDSGALSATELPKGLNSEVQKVWDHTWGCKEEPGKGGVVPGGLWGGNPCQGG